MKKIILSGLFILLVNWLFAQQKGEVAITRDTINISGYIYNYDGTPWVNATIQSRQKDTIYNLYSIRAKSDENGYFKLNGAKFNDTISLIADQPVNPVLNKGSRYIVLYMPSPRKIDIPIEVTAHRTNAKPLIKFTVNTLPHEIYDIEKEPEYPGGIYRYRDNILKQLVYPQKAIENNIEGIVEIGFTILKDGTLSNFKVLKGLGYGCEDEVIQIMKTMPRWKPGLFYSRAVETSLMIDVEFKLTDK